jgi:hypothetical protein
VAELLLSDRDSVPWRAGYWYLKQRGFKPALTMYEHSGGAVGPSSRWEEMRGGLAKTVAALTEGIRGGDFPVFSRDAQCTGRCPFATICRITQVRSLEKTWHPADPKA